MNGNVASTVRKVDDLGRIVLPKEQRSRLGIEEGTALSICVEGDKLILKVAEHVCCLCSAAGKNVTFAGKCLCENCIEKIKKL